MPKFISSSKFTESESKTSQSAHRQGWQEGVHAWKHFVLNLSHQSNDVNLFNWSSVQFSKAPLNPTFFTPITSPSPEMYWALNCKNLHLLGQYVTGNLIWLWELNHGKFNFSNFLKHLRIPPQCMELLISWGSVCLINKYFTENLIWQWQYCECYWDDEISMNQWQHFLEMRTMCVMHVYSNPVRWKYLFEATHQIAKAMYHLNHSCQSISTQSNLIRLKI